MLKKAPVRRGGPRDEILEQLSPDEDGPPDRHSEIAERVLENEGREHAWTKLRALAGKLVLGLWSAGWPVFGRCETASVTPEF